MDFLKHHYELPSALPTLPMPDEPSADLTLLKDFLGDAVKVSSAATLGGRISVVETFDHNDFLIAEMILSGRDEIRQLPLTINAFTIAKKRYRVILVNRAPYSNVPAARMGLSDDEWLEKSRVIRLHHECAHYETLRIFGGMKNHPLDEILADAAGQIAVFGDFRADRQRIFFGLHGDRCDGRLSFHCKQLTTDEQREVYKAVDEALDLLEAPINAAPTHFDRLKLIACRSIEDVLGGRHQRAD